MDRIILKSRMGEYLEGLMARFSVVAPVAEGPVCLFRRLDGAAGVAKGASGKDSGATGAIERLRLDCLRPAMSAKEVFFPQNEDLFYYHESSQVSAEPPAPARPMILFGVKPCDLQGIAAQDRLFSAAPIKDAYYLRRRRAARIIGLACPEPGETCFCHFFGLDRFASPLADVFLTDLGDRYYASAATPGGEELLEGCPAASPADERDWAAARQRPAEFSKPPVALEQLAGYLTGQFESPEWEEIAAPCLGCAACTFVCPTCHCFDITDENAKGYGRRVRTWDGCMFPKFTLHTSGHNPRTAGAQRWRQRLLHKFYYFRENQGMISCTGCGRCIDACPAGLDIREILESIAAAAAAASARS